MPTLYLTEDRALVRRDTEDCLLIQIPEQRGESGTVLAAASKKRIPLVKIYDVVVMGEVTMTASALHLLLEKNIEIHFMTHYGKFKGHLSPELSKNSLLRMAQHRVHNDLSKRGELARQFVIGKLSNQRTMLQRSDRRRSTPLFSAEIEQMAILLRQLHELSTDAVGTRTLINGDHAIEGTVQVVGFDQYIGYLHSSVYGRPALALDLMEEFRPIIVDSVIFTLLNNRMLTPEDFHVELGAYRLKKEPRKLFLTRFEERLNEEVTHPTFGYKTKYRRCIELQARLVAKYLTGEIEEYPPLIVR